MDKKRISPPFEWRIRKGLSLCTIFFKTSKCYPCFIILYWDFGKLQFLFICMPKLSSEGVKTKLQTCVSAFQCQCKVGQYLCQSGTKCVDLINLCDGVPHCPDNDDENLEVCSHQGMRPR